MVMMISHWYASAIFALILLGTQRFLYKVSAEKQCNTAWTTCAFMGTVTVLSVIFLLIRPPVIPDVFLLLSLSLLNSVAFLTATVTHMEALKHLPAMLVYPVIRLNMVMVVLMSLYIFNERLSPFQILGVILAVAVMVLLTWQTDRKRSGSGSTRKGFTLVFAAFAAGTGASLTSKFAAMHLNSLAFMAVSYAVSTVASFGLRSRLAGGAGSGDVKTALSIGFVMGVINFAGFYLMLDALSTGPLSIIISLVGMHFVIAVILSTLIYKEKPTPIKALGVALTVVSVILLRLQ
jgi:drug/metabolite transporter (DMT)-like permease